MMKRLTLALALAVFAAAIGTPLQAAAPAPSTSTQVPIVGTTADNQTYSGVFTLLRFATDSTGHLVAVGTLAGTLTNAAGQITATGLSTVALPATATGSCSILHLDLGPLSLNLLGLQVNLSRVVLDITAVPGAGNLLGNLLCSVAGLLDNPTGLAQLLNQILGILQGL